MAEKTLLEGDLSRIQIADVLNFMGMIRANGKLLVRRNQMQRSLMWKDGEIIFAASNSPEHSLGLFLLRNGKITQEQYDEAQRRVGPNIKQGKALVQMGAISPNDLWKSMKNQSLEIVYSLFGWTDGTFSLLDAGEEIAKEKIMMSINPSTAIMEGIRRLDEGARIREAITSTDMVFKKVPGTAPDFEALDMSEHEIAVYNTIDGKMNVRELVGKSELVAFEVERILFQLVSARLIEQVVEEEAFRPVFLDVEDSPELLKIISVYNEMFARLFETLAGAVGEDQARDIFMSALQESANDDLWNGVFFDQYGRFDENMLVANISELPFEQRKSALDSGLNTLLSAQMFEVSQHLDAAGKVDVFRFINDQKAALEALA